MAEGLKAAVYGNTQELKITDDMALPLKFVLTSAMVLALSFPDEDNKTKSTISEHFHFSIFVLV